MPEKVEYILSLKDLFSPNIGKANLAVNKLEGSLHNVQSSAMGFGKELVGALGVTFAFMAGWKFIESGVEAFHELHAAEAQVNAALISTHEVAGLSAEALEENAKALANNVKFSRSAVTDMQSLLLTFTQVRGAIFTDAEPAIMDLATRMKGDLQGASIQVGKALNDPILGLTALRRVGVSFTESQKTMIKHLVATGQKMEAQKIILKELNTEFGGSAKAAFDADPLARFNKMIGSVKMAMGEMFMDLLHDLVPILEKFGSKLKDGAEWLKDTYHALKNNKELMTDLKWITITVVTAFTAFKVIMLGILFVEKIKYIWDMLQIINMYALDAAYKKASVSGQAWAYVQSIVNAVLAANPIGLVIIAIGALIAAIILAYNHFAWFRATVWAMWAVLKEFASQVKTIFEALWHTIHGLFKFDVNEMALAGKMELDLIRNSAHRLADAAKEGWNGGMADFASDHAISPLIKPPTIKTLKNAGDGALDTGGGKTAKVSGSKTVNIRIDIKNLVNSISINTTNLKESTGKIRDEVVKALTSAVNDSQITAGQ